MAGKRRKLIVAIVFLISLFDFKLSLCKSSIMVVFFLSDFVTNIYRIGMGNRIVSKTYAIHTKLSVYLYRF